MWIFLFLEIYLYGKKMFSNQFLSCFPSFVVYYKTYIFYHFKQSMKTEVSLSFIILEMR